MLSVLVYSLCDHLVSMSGLLGQWGVLLSNSNAAFLGLYSADAVAHGWSSHQFDVSFIFLSAALERVVSCCRISLEDGESFNQASW